MLFNLLYRFRRGLYAKYQLFLEFIWWEQPLLVKPILFLIAYQRQKKDKQKNPQYYRPHGIIIFDGLYGSGKTLSMIWYARRILKNHPQMKVYANFSTSISNQRLRNIEDFSIINDKEGSIFLIDEAQKTFEARQWAKFDLEFASQLAENRKMAKLFLVATQNFKHVDIRIRDLAQYICSCNSWAGILFRNRFYTPDTFDKRNETTDRKSKPIRKNSFIGFPQLFESFSSLSRLDKLQSRNCPKGHTGESSL